MSLFLWCSFLSLFFLPLSSSQFADVAVALQFSNANVDTDLRPHFDSFIGNLSKRLKLGKERTSTRLAFLCGSSDGRTRLIVSLFNGTSRYPFENATGRNLPLIRQMKSETDDTDAVFERVRFSVFAGLKSGTGDRPEAPNYLVIFIYSLDTKVAKEMVTTNLDKGADAVIVGHRQGFEYGDWRQRDSSTMSKIDNVTVKAMQSLTEAFVQCTHEITWKECKPIKRGQCRCKRHVKVKVEKKSANSKYCPVDVPNMPCDDSECPPIPMEYGPRPKWQIVLIIWGVFTVFPLIFWPICCCWSYYKLKQYMSMLLEMALDQGEKMVKDAVETERTETEMTTETTTDVR